MALSSIHVSAAPPEPANSDQYFQTEHLKSDLMKRSTQGGVVTLSAQALKFLLSTASTILLARLLTPQDFGLIGMVAIIYGFVSMFQYLGLSTATIQWDEINHGQVSTLFWINLALSSLIALIVMASAPAIATFYHEPRLVGITIGYSLGLFLSGLFIQHEALLNRQMRFLTIAAIDISALLIGLVAGILAAWYGLGYWALVINFLVMTLATAVGNWVSCRWRPGWPVRGSGVRSMVSFGGNITGFNIFTYFARNIDNALIGKYWGASQLGMYAKAYQLLLLPVQQINAPFAAVAIPALSRLQNVPDRYRAAYLKIIEKIAIITMPGVVFMIVTADWLVLFLLGPQWHETSRIFMFLGIAALIQPITKTTVWLFLTQARSREMLRWGIIGGVISILSIVGGLRWGAVGVAASYAFVEFFLVTPLLFWFVGRKGPVRTMDFYRTIAPAFLASVSSLIVVLVARSWLMPFHLIIRLVVALGLVLAASLLTLAVLPAGRLAMQHFKELILLLLKGLKKESVV